jgi:hypothetical protein
MDLDKRCFPKYGMFVKSDFRIPFLHNGRRNCGEETMDSECIYDEYSRASVFRCDTVPWRKFKHC